MNRQSEQNSSCVSTESRHESVTIKHYFVFILSTQLRGPMLDSLHVYIFVSELPASVPAAWSAVGPGGEQFGDEVEVFFFMCVCFLEILSKASECVKTRHLGKLCTQDSVLGDRHGCVAKPFAAIEADTFE